MTNRCVLTITSGAYCAAVCQPLECVLHLQVAGDLIPVQACQEKVSSRQIGAAYLPEGPPS